MAEKLVHVESLAVDTPWSEERPEPTGIPVVLRLFGPERHSEALGKLLAGYGYDRYGEEMPPVVVVPNFYFAYQKEEWEGRLIPCAKLADCLPEAEWFMTATEDVEPTLNNVVIFTVLEGE